ENADFIAPSTGSHELSGDRASQEDISNLRSTTMLSASAMEQATAQRTNVGLKLPVASRITPVSHGDRSPAAPQPVSTIGNTLRNCPAKRSFRVSTGIPAAVNP